MGYLVLFLGVNNRNLICETQCQTQPHFSDMCLMMWRRLVCIDRSIGHSLGDDDDGVRGGHAIPKIGEMGRADLSANLWDRNVRVPFYRQRLIGWK